MKFQLPIKTKFPKSKEVSCFKSLRSVIYHGMPINDKMQTIVGILTFMSRLNLCSAELSMNLFYNLGARLYTVTSQSDNWLSTRENLTLVYANNKGANQPSYPRSLISALVIRYLESTKVQLAPCNVPIV